MHRQCVYNPSFTTKLYQPSRATSAFPRLAATSQQNSSTNNSLLPWLLSQPNISGLDTLQRSYLGPELGYGLIAEQDIQPGTPLISLDLNFAITSEGCKDQSKWSSEMARIILEELDEGENSSKLPWLESLPDFVALPWLYWTEEQILELQDEDTIDEAFRLSAMFGEVCEKFSYRGWDPEVIAWALSLVHSRSFVDRGIHILVPGIDMCNHTITPSACVRTVYSPETCQGAAATEEIAPPRTATDSNDGSAGRFELIAGDDGIKQGEEVTISYGSWPNDVLLLFYGWVEDDNPNDAAVLFTDLFELENFHQRLVDDKTTLIDKLKLHNAQYQRMVVTSNGVDERLLEAANAMLQMKPIKNKLGLPMSMPEFLCLRCQEKLNGYPTSLEEDEALLKGLTGSNNNEDGCLQTAVRYRIAKKRMLHGMLTQLTAN